MREIGSEFSFFDNSKNDGCSKGKWLSFRCDDWTFAFSGRTAIETVLRDIGKKEKALLPSYCCESMIEPFQRMGIKVDFYKVQYLDGLHIELQIPHDCDIVLWCNYFGYETFYPYEQLQEFHDRGGIIIEDITHSLLSRNQYHVVSDYLVASLRKWGALISGGFCSKKNGMFDIKLNAKPEDTFVRLKKDAMCLKTEYLQDGDADKKKCYLQMFSDSNKWLSENYSSLTIDEVSKELLYSWDIEQIRNKRIENAKVIYQCLEDIDFVKPLFSINEMDCPLFVPIVVEKERRNSIRQKLVDREIYCPIHWSRPQTRCDSEIYDIEISLVCDQRYSKQDMIHMVDVIREC